MSIYLIVEPINRFPPLSVGLVINSVRKTLQSLLKIAKNKTKISNQVGLVTAAVAAAAPKIPRNTNPGGIEPRSLPFHGWSLSSSFRPILTLSLSLCDSRIKHFSKLLRIFR
jgi:hypothetical protein